MTAPSIGVPVTASTYLVIPWVENQTWTNMPAGDTEFLGVVLYRFHVDLTAFREFRVSGRVLVAGFAGSDIRVESIMDVGGGPLNLDGAAGPEIPLSAGGFDTDWRPIALASRTPTTLRIMGKEGDGIVDPSFQLTIEFR